ncbi:MAG: aspartate-semialdehyde dehydrogenase, partial [Clostridia bacterium]|nr:aspartate-semialdehyde dehydrogenase [Clostridia bacterium]
EKGIPLIVPEVNGDILSGNEKLIANPNCSTIQCAIPLSVLDSKYTVKEINFTSFQAVSGSGMRGIAELERTRNGVKPSLYPCSIAKNCIPQIGGVQNNGYTEEEMKMINETRKILGNNEVRITATCVRVPVAECHGVDICVTLEKDFDIDEIKSELARNNCIIMGNNCPVNEMAQGTDKVYIGRIRRHIADEKTLHFWCVADNVRRGAAFNAFEIMSLLERRKYEASGMPDRTCDTL